MTALAQADWDAVGTPTLTVDVARLEGNIAAAAATFARAGVALRPHFKTSKCLQVAARQRAAGAAGLTCSTPAEVAALTAAGFDGLLHAHQPVGRPKVDDLAARAGAGELLLTLDSVAAAGPVSAATTAAGATAAYLLDVDTGHHRTGVDPDRAVEMAADLARLPGLRLAGVLTHEGHLAGHGADRDALEAAASAAGSLLAEVAAALRAAGHACDVVSVGSTPGMRSAPFSPGVTEGRPGTYVYYDGNQVRLGSADWEQCALTVLTRVVSVNRDGTAITDAGLKAMSSDSISAEHGFGTVVDLAGAVRADLRFDLANEEHGFLTGATATLRVGDLLRVVPHHACGATNMWSRLLAVHPDGSTETWPVVGRH